MFSAAVWWDDSCLAGYWIALGEICRWPCHMTGYMPVHVWPGTECLWAYWALIGSIASMTADVDLPLIAGHKAFTTDITLVGFLSCVSADVNGQGPVGCESFTAFFTLVWPLSRMIPQMAAQVTLICKLATTNCARQIGVVVAIFVAKPESHCRLPGGNDSWTEVTRRH